MLCHENEFYTWQNDFFTLLNYFAFAFLKILLSCFSGICDANVKAARFSSLIKIPQLPHTPLAEDLFRLLSEILKKGSIKNCENINNSTAFVFCNIVYRHYYINCKYSFPRNLKRVFSCDIQTHFAKFFTNVRRPTVTTVQRKLNFQIYSNNVAKVKSSSSFSAIPLVKLHL